MHSHAERGNELAGSGQFGRGVLDHRQLRMRHQLINVQLIIVQPGLGQHPVMFHIPATHAQAVVERPADQLAFEYLRAGFDAGFEGFLRRVAPACAPAPGRAWG